MTIVAQLGLLIFGVFILVRVELRFHEQLMNFRQLIKSRIHALLEVVLDIGYSRSKRRLSEVGKLFQLQTLLCKERGPTGKQLANSTNRLIKPVYLLG